jgi:hypothetical protein
MQIDSDFFRRDCNLAAPLVLSFYFTSAMTVAGLYPDHDIVIQ